MTAPTIDAFLAHEPADLIGGSVRPLKGDAIRSHNPAAPDQLVWQGGSNLQHVDDAVAAARAAQSAWARTPFEQRIEALLAFKKLAAERKEQIGQLIQLETGKAAWDAQAEAGILAGKIDITLDDSAGSGRSRVAPFDLTLSPTRQGSTRFRPHGVMAVVGPFNFPAHLPNGHIAPALLMGNTIVFKPSDKTPAIGQLLAEMYLEALDTVGAPKGVLNLVQGGADIASRLVTHESIDGILFTGSWPVGRRILQANLDHPGRIVALELGGNNGALIMPDADLKATAIECARAAFITTGQRCTCTRRLVVHKD
ncbi:MAG: aldehyde dehydrogenase family protein, partial [Phycisphaerales bacterium]|nr:aldehyde dehydrogenase family protein [Phycisphaerales bacterium]